MAIKFFSKPKAWQRVDKTPLGYRDKKKTIGFFDSYLSVENQYMHVKQVNSKKVITCQNTQEKVKAGN